VAVGSAAGKLGPQMSAELRSEVLTPAGERVLRATGSICRELGFYLGGGTALALHLGHRRSNDFDWFSEGERFDPDEIRGRLARHGIDFSVRDLGHGSLHGSIENVMVSFLRYRYPLLSRPDFLEPFGCVRASLEDLACMKLAAAAQRGSRKDFFDVAAVCKSAVPLDRALRLYGQKYDLDDVGHVLISLAFFDEADSEPDPMLLESPGWSEVKRWFKSAVRRLSSKSL
jgi:hypothetical protein